MKKKKTYESAKEITQDLARILQRTPDGKVACIIKIHETGDRLVCLRAEWVKEFDSVDGVCVVDQPLYLEWGKRYGCLSRGKAAMRWIHSYQHALPAGWRCRVATRWPGEELRSKAILSDIQAARKFKRKLKVTIQYA